MQVVTDQVVEVEPSTILRHLEGSRPCTVLDSPDGYSVQVEFTYSTSDDGEIDESMVGAKNHYHGPVLNSRAIQSLVQGGTVTYSLPDMALRYHVKLVDVQGEDELRQALKRAFHAFEDHDFGGKDPRRVWNDSREAEHHTYDDYKPCPAW